MTAELVYKEHAATIKAYVPSSAPPTSAECGGGDSRWHHASISLTSHSMRLSVNHQPATEQPTPAARDAVKLFQRLTVGGGTAAGA